MDSDSWDERCLATLNCGRIRFTHRSLWINREGLREKRAVHGKEGFSMSAPIQAKKATGVKEWVWPFALRISYVLTHREGVLPLQRVKCAMVAVEQALEGKS